jgi:hypothetical protein
MSERDMEFEAAEGANTELLAVRVPKGLLEGLEAMARRGKTPLPELVRRLLWYHLAPGLIANSLRRIRERDMQEVARAEGWYPLISEYREFTEELRKRLAAVERLRDTVIAGERRFDTLVEAWSAELGEVWRRIAEVEDALEEEPEGSDTEPEG